MIKTIFKTFTLKKVLFVFIILGGLLIMGKFFFFYGYSYPYTKAIWVWNTDISSEGDTMLKRLEKNHINTIYLSYTTKTSDEEYKTFIRKASEKNMNVHALGGEPSWALDSDEKKGKKFINRVINLNEHAKPEERFSGIQLDIEPHLLDNWEKKKTKIMKEWLQNNKEYVELAHEGNVKTVGASVTFWLDNESTQDKSPSNLGKAFYKVLFDQFDYVAIMSYRNTINSIVSITKNEMQYANKTNKPVILGFNFNDGESHTTYRDIGFLAAEKDMKKAGEIFKDNRGFSGVSIHDYNNWLPYYLKETPD